MSVEGCEDANIGMRIEHVGVLLSTDSLYDIVRLREGGTEPLSYASPSSTEFAVEAKVKKMRSRLRMTCALSGLS